MPHTKHKPQSARLSLFEQIRGDMKKHPYRFWHKAGASVWYWVIGFAVLVLWEMIRYR
jgi:hypothetical protein